MDGKAPVISSKDMSVATSADQMEQGKTVLKMMIEQYKELFIVIHFVILKRKLFQH